MGQGVFNDPRYQALAARVAGGLGGGASTARGVLSQFACEKADGWPPQDNNPGNIHVNAAASYGITGLRHGRGDGGAVAELDSPEQGADLMVRFLIAGGQSGRYRKALAAARANDGAGYIKEVTAAGWGTGYSCVASYYNSSRSSGSGSAVSTPPSTAPSTASTSPGSVSGGLRSLALFMGLATDLWGAQLYHAVEQKIIGSGTKYVASGSSEDAQLLLAFVIAKGHISAAAVAGLPDPDAVPGLGLIAGLIRPNAGQILVPITLDGHADMVAIGADVAGSGGLYGGLPTDVGDVVEGATGFAGDAIAAAIAGIGPMLAGLLVNGAVLVLILFLVFNGVRGLAAAGGEA